MTDLLVRIAKFFLRLAGKDTQMIAVGPNVAKVVDVAAVLCRDAQANIGFGGEWKRHQVYALLQKKFPSVSGRDLGLAIELAIRRM